MTIRKYKPTTNDRRNVTGSDFAEIAALTPGESLLRPLKNNADRNNSGRIMVRHQGGDHKRQYHVTDFKHNRDDVAAVIKTIEYDPNRSANIALAHYKDGVKAYILVPEGLEVGMHLVFGPEADIKVGNALPLENVPIDTVIHGIEMKPGKGGQLTRSTGTSAQVLGKKDKYVLIRLNSDEVRMISATCRATIDSVGNEQHELINIGKADHSRRIHKHPIVRDSVMNPNDYPHGGSEGKIPIGYKAPVSPWGQSAIGCKTRNKKAKSDKLIVRRHTK